MFKALLAASIAMLACCAAAVFAGPTPPPFGPDPSLARVAGEINADPLPLALVELSQADSNAWVPADVSRDFMPTQLASSGLSSPSAAAGDASVIAPPLNGQPAVIPLPSPLYAAVALLAIALIARRLMLRAC